MSQFREIVNYFSYLSNVYNLHICIKDFCGFIPINKDLDEALKPYLAHVNPFCMYIKSDRQTYHTCLTMIRKMYDKFKMADACFFGFCHCGLGEYVIPIINKDLVLGCINIGFFQTNEHKTAHRIKCVCEKSARLDEGTALDLYQKHISSTTVNLDEVLPVMKLIAEYLSYSYDIIRETHSVPNIGKRYLSSNEDTIISHALEYIHLHYNEKIYVKEIADFCHCSESYLSRIFKKRTNVSINTYINKTRIEIAKDDLLRSKDPISNIAFNVGFSDPNYFSRMFTDIIGITPTEFRNRFYEKKPEI